MFDKNSETTKIEIFDESAVPFVYISPLAITKMAKIVDHCKDEVGWLGSATKLSDAIFFIDDVFMFEQEVNATTCEITPEGLAKFGTEILSMENGSNIYNSIRVWGHSHVNMGVTPSGQDDDQVKEFAGENDWFIRIIANKKGKIKIDVFDYERNLAYISVDWEVFLGDFTEELDKLEKEIDEKVTKKSYYTTPKYAKKSYSRSKSKKKEVTTIDSYMQRQSKELEEDNAYWAGYYDATRGHYDDEIYKNKPELRNFYDDGYYDYETQVIYNASFGVESDIVEFGEIEEETDENIAIIEVYDGLSDQEKDALAKASYMEFKDYIIDQFKVTEWKYSMFTALQDMLKK